MLGNIIGGFIVILVGTALLPTVNLNAHIESNPIMHNPEYRLKSRNGQDRSDNAHFVFARTTDKGFPSDYSKEGYTVWSHTINKICVNKNELSKLEQHKQMVT